MLIRTLGPLEVKTDKGAAVQLGAPKTRALFALLLVRGQAGADTNELLYELWDGDPPASALDNLRTYVSALRKALAGTPGVALVRRGGGYALDVTPDDVDFQRFRQRATDGRTLLRGGDPAAAVHALQEAHSLWYGGAFADVPHGPALTAWLVTLREQQYAAMEDLAEAYLNLGELSEAISTASDLLVLAPLREKAYALLMQARYRTGDVAGALRVWHDARRRLDEELGIAPGDDLKHLHQAILNRELPAGASRNLPARRANDPASDGSRIPHQLPRDVDGFTGRGSILLALDSLIDTTSGDPPAAVVITAIAGTAGVGKTALAVHWAHRIAERFPDGQLYVNLRGFDPGDAALSPAEALGSLLESLDIPPQRVPAGLDGRTGLYRSVLAGKRALIVLDNAKDPEQVRPLLPSSAGSLVIVTSRSQMTGLVAVEGAHPFNIDLLSAAEARDMLSQRLGPARVNAEPVAADEIVALCTRLPMALAIVAARAATHNTFTLSAVARELRAARGGLDAFDNGDAVTNLRTIFSWSYRTLSNHAAHMFRLLALLPGLDVSVAGAASLSGYGLRRVRAALAELAHAHLITEHVIGRYTFHDLLRAYARDLTEEIDPPEARDAATRRILDHYLHTAYRADRLLRPDREPLLLDTPAPGTAIEPIHDHDDALAWFTAEHPALLAAVNHAAARRFDQHAWQLSWTLEDFFDWRGHWDDLSTAQRTALKAAERSGDIPGQAHTHRGLARIHTRTKRFDDALKHLDRALHFFTAHGDLAGQAATHRSVGVVLVRQERYEEALVHDEKALELHRAIDDITGQALDLNNIGFHLALLGDYRRSLDLCREALTMHQQIGAQDGEARTWGSLAHAHSHLGHHDEAIVNYQRAIALFEQLGDRTSQAETLTRLGDAHERAGDRSTAITTWRAAMEIFDDLGHPEAKRLNTRMNDFDPPETEK